jgi:uncharacterized protein
MRLPFSSLFMTSPFEGILEHAQKVKECTLIFEQAIECYISKQCVMNVEDYKKNIADIESAADAIKRRIRGHIPKGTLMPVEKFTIFRYLREQDSVLDAVQDTIDWISYRKDVRISEDLGNSLYSLSQAVIKAINEMVLMVSESKKYFDSFSEKQRYKVKDIIKNLHIQEHEADEEEDALKRKAFELNDDPVTMFHIVKLAEIIGSIADHAENAGDMMRAMLAQ